MSFNQNSTQLNIKRPNKSTRKKKEHFVKIEIYVVLRSFEREIKLL